MQEQFNEKYMESEKYPEATFHGKINEEADPAKEVTYPITASGKLTVHGVEKEYSEKGTVTVKGGAITLDSSFKTSIADHKIEIPKLVIQNIAETVAVKLNVVYAPYAPKK